MPSAVFGVLRLAQKYIAPEEFILALHKTYRKIWPSVWAKWRKRELRLENRAYESRPQPTNADDGEAEWDQTDMYPDPSASIHL